MIAIVFPAGWPSYRALLWLMDRGRSGFDLWKRKEDGRFIYVQQDDLFILSASEDNTNTKPTADDVASRKDT